MSIIFKFIELIFKEELFFIYNDTLKVNKTFKNFNSSFLKFNFFLKFLILNYIFLALILNFFFILFYFFKFKINFFYTVNLILKKIPLIKNIQNFLIANLMLHTD